MKEIELLKKIESIESIILFGSALKNNNPNDIDICIFTNKQLKFKEKLKIISLLPEKFDISFYDDLPIHIRKEVLSKGKILFTNNYYRILELMKINDFEYVKYEKFLENYHNSMMGKV